ncbi:MAG TPA: peptidoglycan-binding domain-containing protein, partial [Candidatus Nanoarchaeia archaeon]|nr:peptidoglycan-binding domain-containing protein [Candidatus Nanoarchaeia archaeon]
MFKDLVSNLSYSPQAGGQLTYYLRRLNKEGITRKLSAVFGIFVFMLQIAVVINPASASNSTSPNDIIFGGLNSSDPHGDLLRIWDADRDSTGHNGFRVLFDHYGIGRAQIAAMNPTPVTISSSDHSLLSLGRDGRFAGQPNTETVDLSSVSPPTAATSNPYACPTPHPTLRSGSSGDCVRYLQWSLNHKNGATLAEDGAFGPLTDAAVRAFQTGHRAAVGNLVDGIVGPNTWGALDSISPNPLSGGHVYYSKPLYYWDTSGHTNNYLALSGKRANGSPFWIMLQCGNLVVTSTPAPPPPPPPPTVTPPLPPPPPVTPPP